jgi:HPt (histidine-containing phosphotransfer) domain-containing protein
MHAREPDHMALQIEHSNSPAAENETTALWVLPESLREFVETGDREMVVEILTLFQEDSAPRLRELNDALASGDREAVRKQAHTLKGAALQTGALAMSGLCREIERLAPSAPSSQLLDLACRTWECYERTCQRMLQPGNWA